MATEQVHVTVNGAPVKDFIDKEKATEIEQVRRSVIAGVSRHRPTITLGNVGRPAPKYPKSLLEAQGKIIRDIVAKHPNGISTVDLRRISGITLPPSQLSIATRLGGVFTILGGRGKPGMLRLLKPGESFRKVTRRSRKAIEAERSGLSGTETIAPLAPPEQTRLKLQPNTIRHELHAFAHAMQKLELRRARYMEKLAAAHPGVAYLRILARLERGHGSLWTLLMDRLTGLTAEPLPAHAKK